MHRDELREQIAAEAARLILRGKAADFAVARKRAARWLKRRRLHRDEIPSNQEIQVQLQALSGVLYQERDPATLSQIFHWTRQVLACLADVPAVVQCTDTQAATIAGAPTRILVTGSQTVIRERLAEAGYAPQPLPQAAADTETAWPSVWRLRLRGQFPCEIQGILGDLPSASEGWLSRDDVQALVQQNPVAEFTSIDDEHPEAFEVFQLLLQPLARVQWPAEIHPEGDALYHSLQVFELGRAESPYDEEFLLACLLHDVGWAINPRHPVLSAIDALGSLITERTRFLIEQRPVATHYLNTGECPKSLRRSEDFEEAVLLARCDRAGRVPGACVCTLEEALEYIAGLDSAWDAE